jgi:hypothetical protein
MSQSPLDEPSVGCVGMVTHQDTSTTMVNGNECQNSIDTLEASIIAISDVSYRLGRTILMAYFDDGALALLSILTGSCGHVDRE